MSQLKNEVPSRLWLQGNLLGIFFSGTETQRLLGYVASMQFICTALGVGDLTASTFAAPGQEPESPCEWGAPCSCSVPGPEVLGLPESAIKVSNAYCDPRVG